MEKTLDYICERLSIDENNIRGLYRVNRHLRTAILALGIIVIFQGRKINKLAAKEPMTDG